MMWLYKDKEILNLNDILEINDKCIGFVYCVHNMTLDKKYIGKKNLFSVRNKIITKKQLLEWKENNKVGRPPRKIKTVTESDWLKYVGSNKDVQSDYNSGIYTWNKYILNFAHTKKYLTYLENKQLFVNNVLESLDYYNDNIEGKYYRKDLI